MLWFDVHVIAFISDLISSGANWWSKSYVPTLASTIQDFAIDRISEANVKENIITILCACLHDDSGLGLSCANRLASAFSALSKALEPKSC